MTTSAHVTIWCDAQVTDETGTHTCGAWTGGDTPRAADARRHARTRGWTTAQPGGRDYCPAHKPTPGARP